MRKVLCPQCKNETIFGSENPFRPFCSERCRLIDLGEWASGSYAIPSQRPPDDSEEQIPEDSRRDSEDPS